MEDLDIVVLGAGLSGMSFAYHYNRKVPVFEKEFVSGGLARTIAFNGCEFDLAPHFLHLRSNYAKTLVFNELGNDFENFERHSSIFIHERLIPYPFELNLSGLDEITRHECLESVREITNLSPEEIETLKKGSYQDYALKAFGGGISVHYLLPYNRKIWDTEPAEMTCEWMKLLPTVDKDEIMAHASKKPSMSFGYNASFFYPSQKGIRELADSLAAKLSDIRLNETAAAIDLSKHAVTFKSGKTIRYRTLVSTIPLNELVKISGNEELETKASELRWTTVYNINLIVKGSVPDRIHWIYFPDPELEFYRVSFPKSYFAGSAPAGQTIISVEIGSRDHDLDIKSLQQKAIDRIQKINLFKIKEIIQVHSLIIPVAYCIYDWKRTRIVDEIMAELNTFGIKAIGRYGRWEYSTMEDALLQGRELAAELRISS
jgi:protoporphyrinogen oxidase